MTFGTTDRTLDDPFENQPAKEPLEQFVMVLGRELPRTLKPREMQMEIIRRLCHEFNLRPPVLSVAIKNFLELVGIHLNDAPRAHSTLFIWNPEMSRYEIKTRTCWQQEWSLEIWHEVSEIIFWRCYHKIRWWKQWAASNRLVKPHDDGDEFAYHLLLSPQSVPSQAKKRGYNVYEVAKYYRVPTHFAFRALSSCNNYEGPVLMALLHLNARPPTSPQTPCPKDLFAETVGVNQTAHAVVWKRFFKKRKDEEDVYGLDFQGHQLRNAEKKAFELLYKYLKTNNTLSFEAIDPIYRYGCQQEVREWTVPHILGLDIPTNLTVMTRQSPHDSNEILLQIMLPRFKNAFLPSPKSVLDLILWEEQKQFQQAARSIEARSSRRASPTPYGQV